MNFIDTANISDASIRTTADGYVVAEVPVARTGIQDYAGFEVGKPELRSVRVNRPADEVFADLALASMAHKPVTDDHPSEAVTPDTWRRDARGWTGERIRKDEANGLVYVPMLFADASAIDQLNRGKREVSCGYSCELDWTSGVTNDGQPYDAIQRAIRINHIALVSRGRAGHTCRVGDNWQPIDDHKEPVVATKTITFDGLPVEVTDAAEAVIRKLEGARDALNVELKAAVADTATLTEDKGKLEGEVLALKAQLADAQVTPEKLAKMVADRANLIDMAKKIAPDEEFDADDENSIKAKAVKKKMGDKAPTNPAQIAGAFEAFVATLGDAPATPDAFRAAVIDGVSHIDVAKIAASIRDNRYN